MLPLLPTSHGYIFKSFIRKTERVENVHVELLVPLDTSLNNLRSDTKRSLKQVIYQLRQKVKHVQNSTRLTIVVVRTIRFRN
jgi:hypothetical protein